MGQVVRVDWRGAKCACRLDLRECKVNANLLIVSFHMVDFHGVSCICELAVRG